jgi:hemoglobin
MRIGMDPGSTRSGTLVRPMSEDTPTPGQLRRAEAVARLKASTGVDEAMVRRLVHGFYERVRRDPLIGPVFEQRIQDWEPHLARMCDFWSSVVLMTGRYSGAPMPRHVVLPVDARHYDRWLELFRETANAVCTPGAAEVFIDRATMIARSLEMGTASFNGVLLGRNERYCRPVENAEQAADWTSIRRDSASPEGKGLAEREGFEPSKGF